MFGSIFFAHFYFVDIAVAIMVVVFVYCEQDRSAAVAWLRATCLNRFAFLLEVSL